MSSSNLLNYVIDKKIGSGRCCRVFVGYGDTNDTYTGGAAANKVALKLFKPSDGDYFLNEIAIYHTLKTHPNVVDYMGAYTRLIESDNPKLQSVIVLKYYNNTLQSLMRQHKAEYGGMGFPHSRAARYARDIITGLEYMHSCNVIYGDMKLPNLFVTLEDTIKLGDFSSSSRSGKLFTRACGTINLIPPELLLQQEYDKSVDVWMFACCLYQLYTGAPLFDIDNVYNVNYDCLPVWSDIDVESSVTCSTDNSHDTSDEMYTTSESDGEETDSQFMFIVMDKLLGPAPIKYLTPDVHNKPKKKSKTCTISLDSYAAVPHLTSKKIKLVDLLQCNYPHVTHREEISKLMLQGLVYEPSQRVTATDLRAGVEKLMKLM